jgi:hypothetical protein
MRTRTTVFVAGSLLIFASCSSSQNGDGTGGYGANNGTGTGATGVGANANGASANGASANGATGNSGTGNTSTGATGNTGVGGTGNNSDCQLGNNCSTTNATCTNSNYQCTCVNLRWSNCVINNNPSGGTTGTGATGTGASSGNGTSGSGTGANGNAGNGNAGSGSGTGGACAAADSAAQSSPQVLLFAIDATGSMNDSTSTTGGKSKWTVLRETWPTLVQNLPPTWAVGMMEWACPNCPTTAASFNTLVPIAKLDQAQVDKLSNGLTQNPLGGFTPTECAYNYALDQVQNWSAPAEFADAPRFIVLLTDGVPTVTNDCQTLGAIKAGSIPISEDQYNGLIATMAAGTLNTKIQTFIGGVPGSDDPQGAAYDPMYMLTLLAAAGGTTLKNCTPAPGTVQCPDGTVPALSTRNVYCTGHTATTDAGTKYDPILTQRGTYCHYDLTQGDFAAGLQAALKGIRARLVSCDYPFPAPPPPFVLVDTRDVKVIYKQGGTTDVTLTEAPNDDCTLGGQWYFSGSDPNGQPLNINLCPDTCTTVQADLDATVNIHFNCLKEQ